MLPGLPSRRLVRRVLPPGVIAGTIAAILAAGATASAAPPPTVSVSPGAPNGQCTSSGLQCRTIAAAVAIASAGSTISIGTGTYAEGGIAVLTKNLSFIAAGPDVVLTGDGQAAHTTLTLTATDPVSVSGITFRSRVAQSAPELATQGPVTVSDVHFESAQTSTDGARAQLTGSGAGVPTLSDATITALGPNSLVVTGTPTARAQVAHVTVDRTSSGSGITGDAVELGHADADHLDITGNGTRLLAMYGTVSLTDSSVTAGPGVSYAAALGNLSNDGTRPDLTIRDSEIIGGGEGLMVGDLSRVDSAGSVYRGASSIEIFMPSTGAPTLVSTHDLILPGAGALAALDAQAGHVTFNETVAGVVGLSPGVACASTASLGTTLPAGGCGLAPPPADLGFVDAAGGDFHLTPDSPLVDAGVADDASTAELDGGPRTLDGNADGAAVSDIGPDEYVPVPDTTIGSGPGATRAGDAATFAFGSTTADATFSCVLDGAAPVACDGGGFTTGALGEGTHTFQVAATVAGSTDPTPATQSFALTPAPADDPTPPGDPMGPGPVPVPAPGPGVTPPPFVAPPATKPDPLRLTSLKLSHRHARGRHLSKTVTLSLRVSQPATLTFTLYRRTSAHTTHRTGKAIEIKVKQAETIKIRLNRLASSPKRGTYTVRVASGSIHAESATLALR